MRKAIAILILVGLFISGAAYANRMMMSVPKFRSGPKTFENYQVSDGIGGWENYQTDDGASGWENYQVAQ